MSNDIKKIISAAKKEGDAAVSFFTKKFDGVDLAPCDFRVGAAEIKNASKKVKPGLLAALRLAKENVESFQKMTLPRAASFRSGGVSIEHVFKPVESAGIYVPGGSYSYPSTVIMTAIPACVAGVKRIVMVTPPKNLTSAVLAAADLCGVTEIYRIGGAQAIAALAYGTASIPKVDMIAGPGNFYVTEAKRQVSGDVGIDMLAGPSEVLIIADDTAEPEFVVSDLLAQCEHDARARAFLVSMSVGLSKYCSKKMSRLGVNVEIIDADTIDTAAEIANKIAPEHLQIITAEPEKLLKKIKNAGAVFVGNYTPVAVGDYFAGPSHVLPTGGTARFSSGLSVHSFLKSSAVIRYDRSALKKNASHIIKIAEAEGLFRHAGSIKSRLK